ncbi:MAG: ribosome silencing factor [Bacteroidia bacterium]|nr:ribosome silencing factor [Bacteroidia bacterium]
MKRKRGLKQADIPVEDLLKTIIEALLDKKALDVVQLDLRNIKDRSTDFFIICNGTSDTHCEALSNNVLDEVELKKSERPWHIEGDKHSDWILLDFVNVVVHIFLPRARSFYHLEDLWGDAASITHF